MYIVSGDVTNSRSYESLLTVGFFLSQGSMPGGGLKECCSR